MAMKKGKPKKPTATQRERKRVRQFISRAEKRGYTFDKEFKESLKTAKYQTLKSYTPEKLYKKAEYLNPIDTEKYGAGEIISGTAGRRLERKIATEKGRVTQLTNYQQKHGGQLYVGSDNRLHYTRDPEVAIKATRDNIRKRVEETRTEADKFKERQQEEIRNRMEEAVNAMDSSTVKEELAEYGEEEESGESDYSYEEVDSYDYAEEMERAYERNYEHARLLIDQIDRSLSDVYLYRQDLPEEMRKTIDEIEEMLDNGSTIHFSDIERMQTVAHQAFEYSRGYQSDYLNEPLEEDKIWRDLTQEDYKIYGEILEMLENTSGNGKEILEKIIANAVSQFGEEEVIKTFGDLSESDISDMQFAINYETDINGGRVFSKIARRIYSITGARVSNEMNREIGRAMDTM